MVRFKNAGSRSELPARGSASDGTYGARPRGTQRNALWGYGAFKPTSNEYNLRGTAYIKFL